MPTPTVLGQRLADVTAGFPLVSCRLHSGQWVPSEPPDVALAQPGVEPLRGTPLTPFDLENEPPLRVTTSATGEWVLLCAHHFAFDGLGMVSLLGTLLTGGCATAPDYVTRTSPRRAPTDALWRLLHPADPVARSANSPTRDSFAATEVDVSGPHVTAHIARACTLAVQAYNAERGAPLHRIGLSVAVGGVGDESATYRRLDLHPQADVVAEVVRAMAQPEVPPELRGLPPGASYFLRPVLQRLSDTILVSNLGRLDLPMVHRLEFYPVARGRSAVAVGASGLVGQTTTLTLRARDLVPSDAAALLALISRYLETDASTESSGGFVSL
jgi:hypothetical protein